MNRRKLTTALTALPLAALLAHAGPARADLPDKNADREGWIKASMAGTPAGFCDAQKAKDRTGPADPDFMANQVKGQWDGVTPDKADLDQALYLAGALCKFPGNPDLQKGLTPLWDAFVGFYGFKAADLADITLALDPKRTRIQTPSRPPADTRFADVDGFTQAMIAKQALVTAYGMDFMSYAEILDATPNPSQLLQAAFVAQCVDSYSGSIGRWAICKADALGLDRAKLDKELATATIDPRDRLELKMRFVRLQQTVKAQAARFDAEAKKDDGVAKVIDTLPAAAAKAWAEQTGPHAAMLAWTYKLVDDARANNKKLMNGCDAELLTHLTTYLTAKAPRTEQEMKDAFKDNIGSQLASAGALCFVRDEAARKYWNDKATGHAGYWGLRTFIWHALTSEKIEFDTDRGNDPIGLPKPVVLYANATPKTSMGTIATMKPNDTGFEITFKKETWKVEVCKQWKETNRIDGIDPESGKLIYRSTCVKTATETASSTAEPVTVTKELAAGLKVGVAASFARNDDGSGYPTAIYGDKKRTKLVGAFGVTY